MAWRPRLAAASALLAAAPNHGCVTGHTHRWPVRVPNPCRASCVRHVAALQAATRRCSRLAPRLCPRPHAPTSDLAARGVAP
jgi:hypothetical protein